MKHTLMFLSCLLLVSPAAFADIGMSKDVRNANVKDVKEVKVHNNIKDVVLMERSAPQVEKYVIQERTPQQEPPIIYRNPAPVAPQAYVAPVTAPVVQTTRTTTETTTTRRSGVCRLTEMTYSPSYGRHLGGHFGRGCINILSGWIEFPRTTYQRTMEGPPVVSLLTGITEGAVRAILRTASGLIDIPSGFVPSYTSEIYFHDEPTIGCKVKS